MYQFKIGDRVEVLVDVPGIKWAKGDIMHVVSFDSDGDPEISDEAGGVAIDYWFANDLRDGDIFLILPA